MYTLYWGPGSSSMAPHAALEETGAKFDLKPAETTSGTPRDPEYLKLNPWGQMPTLVIDGKQAIYESAAIVMVLAERHPLAHLAPPHNDPARPLYYQWMVFLTNTLQPTYLRWYYPDRATTDAAGVAAVRDKAREELVRIWTKLDELLGKGPFLLGERFSGADLMLHMLQFWRDALPDVLERWPNVKACVEAVEARPAVQRMLKLNRPA